MSFRVWLRGYEFVVSRSASCAGNSFTGVSRSVPTISVVN